METLEGTLSILLGVQRLSRRMPGESLSICVFGILFLKPCGIGQHYFRKIGGCRGGKNGTGETISNKAWQIACVVDVCVGQKQPTDRGGVNWQGIPVTLPEFLEPLKQAAVDHRAT